MRLILEARKTNLISQIEKLKREVKILKWPEYKELDVRCCTDSVKYSSPDILQENLRN